MILADTDVLIDYLHGIEPVRSQIARYAEADSLLTTAINCFELLSGSREGKSGDETRKLVEVLDALPLDRKAAGAAADVRRELDAKGLTIGMGDSLIAGIALTHNLPLFTRNRKHFLRVVNLKLVEIDASQ